MSGPAPLVEQQATTVKRPATLPGSGMCALTWIATQVKYLILLVVGSRRDTLVAGVAAGALPKIANRFKATVTKQAQLHLLEIYEAEQPSPTRKQRGKQPASISVLRSRRCPAHHLLHRRVLSTLDPLPASPVASLMFKPKSSPRRYCDLCSRSAVYPRRSRRSPLEACPLAPVHSL
jgi:hypothetical protein